MKPSQPAPVAEPTKEIESPYKPKSGGDGKFLIRFLVVVAVVVGAFWILNMLVGK